MNPGAKLPVVVLVLASAGCSPDAPPSVAPPDEPPAILLVTLDTTRADALGYASGAAPTPRLDALAARSLRFSQAYTTAPMTLPAHASMMTGLYPADHGVRENARYLAAGHGLLAERLGERGYATAAFVSGLPLAGRFGLARGFDRYDDAFGDGRAERSAAETTERALAWLRGAPARAFLWVHYFDPHEPYEPPEPFRSRSADPYLGEIAAMDEELGRLLAGFEERFAGGPRNILVVGDHGEGRGDHGEMLHGNLLSQGVMRVPLLAAGSGVAPGTVAHPVSVRRVFGTVLGWAGLAAEGSRSLLGGPPEVVLAEAMKPWLQYGWQPQVMAVRGDLKVIRAGRTEVYDLAADPAEARDLAGERQVDGELRRALAAYLAKPGEERGEAAAGGALSAEDRERLASLGYVTWEGRPAAVREDAPRPRDMAHLFTDLDAGSRLFVEERYAEAIPVFRRVLDQDPNNLMVALRLAVAHSLLGEEPVALELFERARRIRPDSVDVRHYLGMHYLRVGKWDEAGALLASVVAETPDRLPALAGLARIRERQGDVRGAAELLERLVALETEPVDELVRLGDLRMAAGETAAAIAAFERARALDPEGFARDLELGVCYLADRRFADARDCLERVPEDHPGHAMALFKRAQVSVLLDEPDRADRIRAAWEEGDAATRRLIESETLFRGVPLR